MILKELYKKDITRDVNPAVSAGDLKEATIHTEIEEYVFTQEIIQGLYDVISGVREASASHNGIWISGYYGSGKSHFLKYLNYCLKSEYGKRALERLAEEVQKTADELGNVTPSEVTDIRQWLSVADVKTILFNIGTVHNANTAGKNTFVEVFWNEFNKFRGYNQFNLSLAQYLEKPLDEAGKFEAFKAALAEDCYDWELEASDLAQTELDYVLEQAQAQLPSLSIDSIRERIVKNDFVISVEKFKNEITLYTKDKGPNFRLIFFVDEVSQFINNHKELLLQLQEIVTGLHDASEGKVWVACTAQQSLSEIVSASQISQTTDDYGKIMGRFEIQVKLGNTTPEYITKVRLLEKNGTGEMELNKLYNDKKTALETQFKLPTGYNAYTSQEDFTDFYPFVPYQFKLIMQVLDSFVDLQYVDKEKKGTERSIIKITHTAAKNCMDSQVGSLVSFDQLYNAVLEGGLTIIGQRSISNAISVIEQYKDKAFGRKVVNVLFMICHMADSDKVVFPATIENIVNLMTAKVDEDLLPLKEKVVDVLEYLEGENIIRKEKSDKGIEYYNFYTEDEREVALLISNQRVDDVFMADQIKTIVESYVGAIPGKKSYYSRNASIGLKIYGRQYLTTNAPDMWIQFILESDVDQNTVILQNEPKQLIFYMDHLLRNNPIKDELYRYCQTQKYLAEANTGNAARAKANEEFRSRAAQAKKAINEAFKTIIDGAIIISGQTQLTGMTNRGKDRLDSAILSHLGNLYPYAKNAHSNGLPSTNAELADAIRRPIGEEEYNAANPMSLPEEKLDEYLSRMTMTTRDVAKIVTAFDAAPYGWAKVPTIYFLNELVRRRKWAFSFNNVKNVLPNIVAQNIMSSTSSFTMESADVIPAELVRQFTAAWDDIFGNAGSQHSSDAFELFDKCKSALSDGYIRNNRTLYHQIESYPFKTSLYTLIEKQETWAANRDAVKFFTAVIADREEAKALADKRKQLSSFYESFVKDRGGYVTMLEFIRGNEENFNHLTGDDKTNANNLKALLTDEWPIDSMRAYNKLKTAVESALRTLRDDYIQKVKDAYTKAYEELKNLASNEGVDTAIIETAEHAASSKITTSNLDSLMSNVNTDQYYQINVDKISAEKAKKAAAMLGFGSGTSSVVSGYGGQSDRGQVLRQPKSVTLRLSTRTTRILRNSADVDAYLENLKSQIMRHVDNNEEVTIL
ncbi:MAG: BREX system P-loop protein BrxC [Bacteroidales bacterium]|nr:BREX system P-loop protein BrxC [Bacteroidales bacterium]